MAPSSPPMSAGSSPHTRGTPAPATGSAPGSRFIPAYAGNAPIMVLPDTMPPVHPRIRGERGHHTSAVAGSAGSSPHTRGTRQLQCNQHGGCWFIPAYAGNAWQQQPAGCQHPVHPRIRGERLPQQLGGQDVGGSSPHTRGTPAGHVVRHGDQRFIPAYAGNAFRRQRSSRPRTVHPRIRGERW